MQKEVGEGDAELKSPGPHRGLSSCPPSYCQTTTKRLGDGEGEVAKLTIRRSHRELQIFLRKAPARRDE